MGNLFNPIDTKICRDCRKEKPVFEFPSAGLKNGIAIKRSKCRECYNKALLDRMTDEARELKRERDRAAVKTEKGKARLLKSKRAWRKKAKIDMVLKNVGAFCVVHWHTCERCGRVKYFKNKEYESTICGVCARMVNNTGRKYTRSPKPATCPDCGVTHTAMFINQRCEQCKLIARANALRKSRATYGKSIRDRARRHGIHYEPVNRRDVYKRDRYRCYRCGIRVVVSSKYADNMATIDHVIPLVMGGSNTYDNVRTCCALCNSIKGSTIDQGQQIGLFCSVQRGQEASDPGRT